MVLFSLLTLETGVVVVIDIDIDTGTDSCIGTIAVVAATNVTTTRTLRARHCCPSNRHITLARQLALLLLLLKDSCSRVIWLHQLL